MRFLIHNSLPPSIQSPRWESNPRCRHTRTAGSRYNTEASCEPKRLVGDSNPHRRVDNPVSCSLGRTSRSVFSSRLTQFSAWGGNRTHIATKAAVLQTAWRPTARPQALSGTRGSRTHIHRGLSSAAIPGLRIVPRPRRARKSFKRPVGLEPTHPPWQGGRQPLHHGRDSTGEWKRWGSNPHGPV